LELTRAAADNFHRSWRKRHGVVLDGEVAAVHYRRGALDAAAKLYEKVQFNYNRILAFENAHNNLWSGLPCLLMLGLVLHLFQLVVTILFDGLNMFLCFGSRMAFLRAESFLLDITYWLQLD
jgi:hypothetical protein